MINFVYDYCYGAIDLDRFRFPKLHITIASNGLGAKRHEKNMKNIRNLLRLVGNWGPIKLSMKVDISLSSCGCRSLHQLIFQMRIDYFSLYLWHANALLFISYRCFSLFHFNTSLLCNHHCCSFSRSQTFASLFLSLSLFSILQKRNALFFCFVIQTLGKLY